MDPPPTPLMPSGAAEMSLLFGQTPIYEGLDDLTEDSIEIGRRSHPGSWDLHYPGKTLLRESFILEEEDELGLDGTLLEDKVLTGTGEADKTMTAANVEYESSFMDEAPSVFINRRPMSPPTPVRDDYFRRRLSTSRRRSSSVASFKVEQPSRRLSEGPSGSSSSIIRSASAHSLISEDIPSSSSNSSLGPSQGESWTGDEKSIMEVKMAWRAHPLMTKARHVSAGNVPTTQGEEAPGSVPHKRRSLARFGPPKRLIVEMEAEDEEPSIRIPASTTIPLDLNHSTSRRGSRADHDAVRSEVLPMRTAEQTFDSPEPVPFPILADTSGSADSDGIDFKAEKRMSRSEQLVNFFTGFLSGMPREKSTVDMRDESIEIGRGQKSDVSLENARYPISFETVDIIQEQDTDDFTDRLPCPEPYQPVEVHSEREPSMSHEILNDDAPVRVRVPRVPLSRAPRRDFIDLQPPTFDDDELPPVRPSNAPYFALKPSRTIPSKISILNDSSTNGSRAPRHTMSAFACAALAKLPPPGKGSSAAGQPVRIRDSERASDLEKKRSLFDGLKVAPMKRTVPIVGRTPGKASRARAMQREMFDRGVKDRLEIKDKEKRRALVIKTIAEEQEYKKRRRETVIRANPLPEMYRRA
ncbi:hypothetical protein BD324DRAFT_682014 [Kockovaella imperatae]|uniref:TPX2 C-terminal domain-containing protein n=1 Tax=Kockovaella imperatae TaxID=4999 RepID=A0A1Y1UFL2_9TREE|nr:hypothetical protein BD324DRAFT_682014 [Kockovaella imperatae]ORX35855.1 hypothetical protein BD324DRAFT_682014 [Kockovaella imperatae]